MEKVIDILTDINPENDYYNDTKLIDDGHIDSLALLGLISELEDEFDVEVLPTDMVPSNFNSAAAITEMVLRLQNKR